MPTHAVAAGKPAADAGWPRTEGPDLRQALGILGVRWRCNEGAINHV